MPPDDSGTRGEPRVFVEIGTSHELGVGDQTPPDGPAVAFSVAHLLATDEQTASMPWRLDQSNLDGSALGKLTVLPHLSDVAPGYVRLDFALRQTVDDDTGLQAPRAPGPAAVETSLVLEDQQTAVVKTNASAAIPSQTFLVTPYFIRSDRDLSRLLECKRQARSEALR